MTRDQVLLAILAAGRGRSFTPVQLQKAAFLADRNAPWIFDQGSRFNFRPYDYGPFDHAVYQAAEGLEAAGYVIINRANGNWKTYSCSLRGGEVGQQYSGQLPQSAREYLQSIAEWVLRLSFAELVKSIYETYPDMRVNSIFRDTK